MSQLLQGGGGTSVKCLPCCAVCVMLPTARAPAVLACHVFRALTEQA